MKLLCVLLLCAGTAMGQVRKQKVVFSCNCDDQVGARVASALRDVIAKSPRYEFAEDGDDKALPEGQLFVWCIRMNSLDGAPGNEGNITAMSVVLTAGPAIYLKHEAALCGKLEVQTCADNLYAYLDATVANWGKHPSQLTAPAKP